MKKVLIGGFLSLIGTIWCLAIILFVSNNLVSSWNTPPGRFLSTIFASGMIAPLLIACVFLFGGVVIMGIEYFRKEK